jgi:hypothetical protein
MTLLIKAHCEGFRLDEWGFIPGMLNDNDPRSTRDQLDAGYAHGGGWRPFKGHTMLEDGALSYPDDMPLLPRSTIYFREDRVVLYDHGWVAIVKPDGSYEVCRMD